MEKVNVDFVIVGAGVVGLALADRISTLMPERTILLVERHAKLGQESSSRNSEVIHAGIYYDNLPLKAKSCVRGRALLYEFCAQHKIPHRNCGKWILATANTQDAALEKISRSAASMDVPLEERPAAQARSSLGNSAITRALWSPTTGIVDSHSLMLCLESRAISRGVLFQYGSRLGDLRLECPGKFFARLSAPTPENDVELEFRCLINAAGLSAAHLARQLMPQSSFEIRPCRGRYFSLSSRYRGRYESLIYPIPDPAGGLGTHLTIDLQGRGRLGPDVDWLGSEELDAEDPALYRFAGDTEALKLKFWEAGRALVPDLEVHDLEADYIGARPKLFVEGELHKDFKILDGGDGSVHLLGIESPGLTASLALAEIVGDQARLILS